MPVLIWIFGVLTVMGTLLLMCTLGSQRGTMTKNQYRLAIIGSVLFVVGGLATYICASHLPKPPPAKAGAYFFAKKA